MASPIYTAMAYYARPYNQLLVKILFNWSIHGLSTTCMNFLTFVQRWSYNWRGRSLTTRCYHRLLLYSCPPEMYQCARTGLTQAQAMAINGSNGAYTDVSRSIFCATRLNGERLLYSTVGSWAPSTHEVAPSTKCSYSRQYCSLTASKII